MEINKIVRKHLKQILKEGEEHITEKGTYMVLQNLQQLMDDIQIILKHKHHSMFPKLVTGEHAWAGDHIATSKDDIEEVANFIKYQIEGNLENDINEASGAKQQAAIAVNMKKRGVEPKDMSEEEEIDESKNCPNDPGKWAASKALAKSKFDVYPSAYANGFAAKNYKKKGGTWRKCKK